MNNKFLKMAFAGLVLSVSGYTSVANAGLITLSDTQEQTVNFQQFDFSWAISDWAVGTSIDLTIELQADLGQSGELAFIDAESVALGSHGDFGSGLNGWTSLFPGTSNEWRVSNSFILTSADVATILADDIFEMTVNFSDNTIGGNGVHLDFGSIGTVSPYVKVDLTYSNTSIPEPSTLAILGLGLMGLAARRFKKQA